MGEKNKTILLWISALMDLFINLSVILFALLTMDEQIGLSFGKRAMSVALILAFFTSLVYFLFNIYSLKRFERLHKALFRTATAQLTAFFFALITVVILSTTEKNHYIFLSVCYGASFVLMCLKRTLTLKLIHVARARRSNHRKIVVAGNGLGALAYAKQIENNIHFGYNIIGCVTDSNEPNFKKLGDFSQLNDILKSENPFEVVIALDTNENIVIQEIIDICDRNGIRTCIVPVTYKYFKSKCQIDMIGDLPIINTRTIPLDNIANMVIKRAMDIIISLIMIVLTSPIMLFALVGVKITSRGPAIFKQKRVGKNNKPFTMYKFRSMKMNDESDEAWTTNDDPRKTKFGTFMRKTGIDELPQLFNVLFGTMSIIGPRPELPKFVEEYSKKIPLYMIKHQVKPGITGLAQIYGFRGDTSIEKRIELDIKYIEGWSVANDIKILVITPFKMFNRNEKFVK